jgi:SynChlorMet cassette protein ScmD
VLTAESRPVASPGVVLREEFDDWAVLFDPDTGNAAGVNPTGVVIWKLLDGRRTVAEVAAELPEHIAAVPPDALAQTLGYVTELAEQSFVAEGLPASGVAAD